MMTRIVFCLFITLCTMSYSVVNSQSGLSALLQQTGSSSSAKTLESSGLSALLSAPKAFPVSSVAPVELQSGLLQQFVTVQSNPLYVKAMTILSNSALQEIYKDALFSMQLFFLKYTTNDLSKLSKQSIAVNKPSLSSLLTVAASTSTTSSSSSGAIGLASLLSSQTIHNPVNSKTSAQSSVNSLLKILNAHSSLTPVVKKSNIGLQNLLDVVATPLVSHSGSATSMGVVSQKKPVNNLSALLAGQD